MSTFRRGYSPVSLFPWKALLALADVGLRQSTSSQVRSTFRLTDTGPVRPSHEISWLVAGDRETFWSLKACGLQQSRRPEVRPSRATLKAYRGLVGRGAPRCRVNARLAPLTPLTLSPDRLTNTSTASQDRPGRAAPPRPLAQATTLPLPMKRARGRTFKDHDATLGFSEQGPLGGRARGGPGASPTSRRWCRTSTEEQPHDPVRTSGPDHASGR